MPLQPRFQPPEDRHCGFFIRFFHHNRPETAIQRRIFFDKFPIFCQGCGAEDLQLPSAQCRFQNIGSVDRTFRCTCTDNRVHFVHKKDHITAAAYLRQYIPQALFKFTAVFGACHQIRHVQADQPLVLQLRRNRSFRHPLCQTFRNGRFAHTGFPDQGRVILILTAQYSNNRIDLFFSADHRIH